MKATGATWNIMKFRGTTFTPALPKSEKSFRKTVTFSDGRYEKTLRWKRRAFSNERATCGTRYDWPGAK